MSLQSIVSKVRQDCQKVLETRRLSQQEFAEKHEISYSWLNKFLKDKGTDYRVGSIDKVRIAVQSEKRAS